MEVDPMNPPGLAGAAALSAASQSRPMDIQGMFQMLMEQGKTNQQKLLEQGAAHQQQLAALRKDQTEIKDIASKALVQADSVKEDLTALSARVAALERGGNDASASSSASSSGARSGDPRSLMRGSPYMQGSRWEQLGGPDGNLLVVGGFPLWSRPEKMRELFTGEVLPKLSPEARNAIDAATLRLPGVRGHVLQVEINKLETVRATRKLLMDIVKETRAKPIEIQALNSTAVIWLAASKPAEHRAQDREVTTALMTIKRLFGIPKDEKNPELDVDYSKGRVFYKDRLVVHRVFGENTPQFRIEALQQLDAQITMARINDLKKEILREKEEKQSTQ